MNFETALEHLKQGSIITNNNNSLYYVIEGKQLVSYYYKNGTRYRITSSFGYNDLYSTDWRVLTIEEENQLSLRTLRRS